MWGRCVNIYYNSDHTIQKLVYSPAHGEGATEYFVYKNGAVVKSQIRFDSMPQENRDTNFSYDSQGKLISAQTTSYSGSKREKSTYTFAYNNQSKINRISMSSTYEFDEPYAYTFSYSGEQLSTANDGKNVYQFSYMQI